MKSIKLILIVVSFFTSQIFAQDNWTPLNSGPTTTINSIAPTIANQNTSNTWSALGTGMNGFVQILAVIGTDLYAGGDFTTAGGVPANYIAKWDGTSWSSLASEVGDGVHVLTFIGTSLYAGGVFTTAGGG